MSLINQYSEYFRASWAKQHAGSFELCSTSVTGVFTKLQTLQLQPSLLESSFISDGITSITAQFFPVMCNAALAKMIVITASTQSTQSTPPWAGVSMWGCKRWMDKNQVYRSAVHTRLPPTAGGFWVLIAVWPGLVLCDDRLHWYEKQGEGMVFFFCGCRIDSFSSWRSW